MELNAPVEPKELARRLRMIMGDQRWSRKRLAEASGISRPSLSSKLDGKVQFTYEELVILVDVLNVSWEDLLSNPPDDQTFTAPKLGELKPRTDRKL